jgi:hypothetical protein
MFGMKDRTILGAIKRREVASAAMACTGPSVEETPEEVPFPTEVKTDLTLEECAAIADLRALAKRWPKSLWLAAKEGHLLVLKHPSGDIVYVPRTSKLNVDRAVCPEYVLEEITGIYNERQDY